MKKFFHFRKSSRLALWLCFLLVLPSYNTRSETAPNDTSDLESSLDSLDSAIDPKVKQELEKASQDILKRGLSEDLPKEKGKEKAEAEASLADTEEKPVDIIQTNTVSTAEEESRPASGKNGVSNLEFKMVEGTSRVQLQFKDVPKYREVINSTLHQVVYFFENTESPNRLQRAYDTTEFSSPVTMFTLLQMPGGGKALSKLVIQLRENKRPQVYIDRKTMSIDFAAPSGSKGSNPLTQSESTEQIEDNIYANDRMFNGKTIQLELKNTDIQDALRFIAKTSGYNIVIGEDVTGKIGTMSLQGVPWDQAFTLLLQSKRLGYIRQGNVLRVATLTSLKAEKDAALANEQSKNKVDPLKTVLVPISYAKAAEVSPRVKGLLTERGTVETDVRTNTVIVRDVDKSVTKAQKLLLALDTQPPRVNISAKFVEMTSTFTKNLGINGIGIAQNYYGVNYLNLGFSPSNPGGSFTISANDSRQVGVQLALGELENKVKTLDNPSLTVVANQQASITRSLSFFLNQVTTSNGQVTQSLQQVTTNLSLDVLPIISSDGSIFMTVNLKNDIPNLSTTPTINSRSVATQVLIENGDTAVIGGLFKTSNTASVDGIPLLKNIPILGYFFSKHQDVDDYSEIYVMITAKILNPEEAFKRSL